MPVFIFFRIVRAGSGAGEKRLSTLSIIDYSGCRDCDRLLWIGNDGIHAGCLGPDRLKKQAESSLAGVIEYDMLLE
jgi:hypothetical protein